MRTFLCRIGLILPAALFALFLLLILVGAISNSLGAGPVFFCSFYCKAGVVLFALAVAASIYTQAKACCGCKEKENVAK
jgi:hypothetical protein